MIADSTNNGFVTVYYDRPKESEVADCKCCGKEFEVEFKKQKYCSSRCEMVNRKNRHSFKNAKNMHRGKR